MAGLKAPKGGSKKSAAIGKRPELDAGTYPARLVQVIDLGLQPQRAFDGVEKPPRHSLYTTYELCDEFMLDENDQPDESRPLWVSEDFPFFSLDSERAKSTLRYTALDPELHHDGDWSEVVSEAVNVTLVINKKGDKTYTNIASTSAMRAKDKARAEPLKNEAKVFSLAEPDLNVFLSLPEWLQDKIKSNLEYAGSKLEKLLGKGSDEEEEEQEQEAEGYEQEEGSDDDW